MNAIAQGLLTASVMLTLAWGVAAIFLRQFPVTTPRTRQFILAGVLLQGLMLVRLPVELPWLAPEPQQLASVSAPALAPLPAEVELPEWAIQNEAPPALSAAVAPASVAKKPMDVRPWILPSLLGVWICGAVLLLARGLMRYRKLCRLVAQLPPAPTFWLDQWEAVCESTGRSTPPMLVSETAGPMLVRRPRGYVLVVPRHFWESLSLHERRGVLLHELAHLCRRDVWRQAFVRLAAAIHWWNPASWWCVRHFEESAEWACDEFLTKQDPRAAQGLARSLVRLVEEAEKRDSDPLLTRGIGVQSMAAPPLTQRVCRLLKPVPAGDSAMKQIVFAVLAVGLLSLSIVQFRFVAAQPPEQREATLELELDVLDKDLAQAMSELKQRLDATDRTTSELQQLLETNAGRIALAGVLDHLADQERDLARSDALPRFIEKHFEQRAPDRLVLRPNSTEAAESWTARSKKFGESMDALTQKLQSIEAKMSEAGDANQIAKRMLKDEHAAAALMIVELDGRVDPIERYLDGVFEEILVRRDDQLIVIPNLPSEPREHLERFETAGKIFAELKRELPLFAPEMATPDERHKNLVQAMKSPALAAIVAFELSERVQSPTAAVEKLLEQIEDVSRDTATGLVIQEEEAWEHLGEMLEHAARAESRAAEVQQRLRAIASQLDTSDPMTEKIATFFGANSKGEIDQVVPYMLAAEIPYAEFDLAEMVGDMLSEAMEKTSSGLAIRSDQAEEVTEKCREILGACRRLRRYLRKIDTLVRKLDDTDLAESLSGPGRMVLLSEMRRSVEQSATNPMELLESELFESVGSNKLRVKPQHRESIRELAERAEELKAELDRDDF